MASVNIEFTALLDPRFRMLAKLSGQTRFDSIGRMAAIWAYCVEKGQAIHSLSLIDAIAEIDGYGRWVVEAELGELDDIGYVRIKGTVGRIEWLSQCRENASLGGKARAKKAKRNEIGRFESQPLSTRTAGVGPATRLVNLQPTHPATASPSSSATSFASTIKKRRLADPTDTTKLWNFYSEALHAKSIQAVHEGAKSNMLCQRLVKSHGLDLAKQLVSAFLSDEDAFVSDKAWSLGLLSAQQQKYLARLTVRPRAVLEFGGDE